MRIFTVGDLVSEGALRHLEKNLGAYQRFAGVQFTIVNGENVQGLGIVPQDARRILLAGADVLTLGNHAFSRREILEYIDEEPAILRPENFSSLNPGSGSRVFQATCGYSVAVLCVMGRVYSDMALESPFDTANRALKALDTPIKMVEIHGEATSEKAALAWYLDGRCSAVYGTHTHVQTADECILPKGTGFITDIGMSGPVQSILGMDVGSSIQRLMGAPAVRYKAATGPCVLRGALFEIDDRSGRCISVERVTIS